MLKLATSTLLIAVAAYAVVVAVVYLMQRRVLFPATAEIYRDPSLFGWNFENFELTVDGGSTHGWWIPLENARGAALFSHGNAGNIADRLESIGLLRSFGLSVLAYDYGGYGKSTGAPSEARLAADVRAVWAHLTGTLGVPPDRVIIFGRSLGGAVSADLAQDARCAGVVLESTFLSTVDVAREAFPWLPMRWILRDRLASKEKIGRISSPLLIIHSPADEVIPYHHGRTLFELAPEPKWFLEIRGGHNDGFVMTGEAYRRGWEEFLDRVLGPARKTPGAEGQDPAPEEG